MQSRFLLGMIWMLSSALYLSSCTSGGGKSSASGSSSNQPVIDASGKKIYSVDPSTGATISASGISSSDPRFANAAVVIPPGALSIPVDISIFQAQSLVSTSTASAVGSSNLTAAGPAVAVLPSQPVSISNPLAISIPFSALTSLTGDKQIVVIAIYPGESKNELETFVGAELDLGNPGVVKLSVTRFGAFQVAYSDTVIEKIKVETEIKIEQKTAADDAADNGGDDAADNGSSNNPYSAYNGTWFKGCTLHDGGQNPSFMRHSVTVSVDSSGAGTVTGLIWVYNDSSCLIPVASETRTENITFVGASETEAGAHNVESVISTLNITTYGQAETICGIVIQPETATPLTSDLCMGDERYSHRFLPSQDLVKVVGNMLFTGECPDGSNCSGFRPPMVGKNYMTRKVSGEPNFELFGPPAVVRGQCAKFTLKKSNVNLTKSLRLAQNMDDEVNGRFYIDENCQTPFESSPLTAVLAVEQLSLDLYYKHSGNPGKVFMDIRDADNRDLFGIFSQKIEVEEADPVIDATAFLGNWQSGCRNKDSQSVKEELRIFQLNALFQVESQETVYNNIDCQDSSFKSTVHHELTFGAELFGGRQIDILATSIAITNLSGSFRVICGHDFGTGETRTFNSPFQLSTDCQGKYAEQFAPSKQMLKVVGNMLFAGDCSFDGGNCVNSYPSIFEKTYFTKVLAGVPNFSLSYSEPSSAWYLQPQECRKFTLRSDRPLEGDIELGENSFFENSQFYMDSICSQTLSSLAPKFTAGSTSFELYFKPVVSSGATVNYLDVRDGANPLNGLVSLRVPVQNYVLSTTAPGNSLIVGNCYAFQVSAAFPVASTLIVDLSGWQNNSPFVHYGTTHSSIENCLSGQVEPSGHQFILSSTYPTTLFFKPNFSNLELQNYGTTFYANLKDFQGIDKGQTSYLSFKILPASGG